MTSNTTLEPAPELELLYTCGLLNLYRREGVEAVEVESGLRGPSRGKEADERGRGVLSVERWSRK